MNEPADDTVTVTLEREFGFPPEKIWRALTQPELLAEWLMRSDFLPVLDHRFSFTADWGSVACQVLAVKPGEVLSYTWVAMGAETIVTWTLRPTASGTMVHMQQAGFRRDLPQAFNGAKFGWQRFFDRLAGVLENAG